jgi:hypothetical protein
MGLLMNLAHLRSAWRVRPANGSDHKLPHALEELAVELAAKAAELNSRFDL